MHSTLRAGLVYLFLAVLFALAASAVPITRSTFPATSSNALVSVGTSTNADILLSPFNLDITHGGHSHTHGTLPVAPAIPFTDGVAARDEEIVTLYRRNRFTDFFHHLFHKIGEGFHKMAEGIKHVAQKIGEGIKHVAQKIGSGIKHVAQKIGEGIKHVAIKIGTAIKSAAIKVGQGIKHVAQKIGTGIKIAAQRVGKFMQTTGAKIAKVGLKILSTIHKAVSKVIGWIPAIGKPLARVMDAEAEGENALSDKINVHIGGSLGHAMDNMSKAQKIMGYIPRELVEAISQGRAVGQLSERELYAVNAVLAAREGDAVYGLLERRWERGEEEECY